MGQVKKRTKAATFASGDLFNVGQFQQTRSPCGLWPLGVGRTATRGIMVVAGVVSVRSGGGGVSCGLFLRGFPLGNPVRGKSAGLYSLVEGSCW